MLGCLAIFLTVPVFVFSFCLCAIGNEQDKLIGFLMAAGASGFIVLALYLQDQWKSGGSSAAKPNPPLPGSYPQAPPAPSKIFAKPVEKTPTEGASTTKAEGSEESPADGKPPKT